MRRALVLFYAAAAMIAAAPWAPVVHSILRAGRDQDARLSFVDIARGSDDLAGWRSAPLWRPEGRSWHGVLFAAFPKRIDGRPECVGAAALVFAVVGLAVLRRSRHAALLALVVGVTSAWTWLRLRADLDDIASRVTDLPLVLMHYAILPWPWLLLGGATILLACASLHAPPPPEPPHVDAKVFE